MQVSLEWLKEYVDLTGVEPKVVAAALTDVGIEVEEIKTVTGPFGADIVIGKVLTSGKHPDADKLSVNTVDVGKGEPLHIVCGAPNVRSGLTVAVATTGCTLPNGLKIKATKIRGEKSEGMICSGKELGISEDQAGILELPESFKVGEPLSQALNLTDVVLTIAPSPNRGDALGYLGVAREVAAKLGKPLKEPKEEPLKTCGSTKEQVAVELTDKDGCMRYVAYYIRNVAAVPSPDWLKRRIEAAGLRPINLVVDATNYVMMECGQPIHAFDARFLGGRGSAKRFIEVRMARAQEKIRTLDGVERQLNVNDVLICDGEKPVALAGVMGGENSEVKGDTTEIIVEVACFDPVRIRKTAKRLALHTDSSHRFERGIDVEMIPRVARRVAEILSLAAKDLREKQGLTIATPEASSDMVDQYPQPVSRKKIALRLGRAQKILGLPILSMEECIAKLSALQLKLLDKTSDRSVWEIPSWRHDLEKEIDLIEDVARHIGYDKIPYAMPFMDISPLKENPFIDFCENARTTVAQCGFAETISFPFISNRDLETLRIKDDHPLGKVLKLANPLSEEFSFLQTTLIPNLLRAVVRNRYQGIKGSRLFECGRVYMDALPSQVTNSLWGGVLKPAHHLTKRALGEQRPHERTVLAGVIDQPLREKMWHAPEEEASFFHAKSVILSFMNAFGLSNMTFRKFDANEIPFLHPGSSATIFSGDEFCGFIGELHPQSATSLDLGIEHVPVLFEIDLERLFTALTNEKRTAKKARDIGIWRFPPVTRDFAFVVERTLTHEDFEKAIEQFPRKRNLRKHVLFDLYQGEKIPTGKKSLAYSFWFQSPDKTLTDQEVEPEISALLAWLGEKVGASLR